jgi:hypothetical protein
MVQPLHDASDETLLEPSQTYSLLTPGVTADLASLAKADDARDVEGAGP